MAIDLNSFQTYHYLVIGGGCLAAVALGAYFMAGSRWKVPAAVACGLGGLAAGLALGVLAMAAFGYHWNPENERPAGTGPAPQGKDGPAGPGAGASRGPSPKRQLTQMIVKLDQLTARPLEVKLSPEQRRQVLEQLDGLTEPDVLHPEEAQQRLSALAALLKSHKVVFEKAGYQWPGESYFQPPGDFPNPFKGDTEAKHLNALRQRLANE